MAGVNFKDMAQAAGQRLGALKGRLRVPAGSGLSLAPLTRLTSGITARIAALRSGTAPAALSASLDAPVAPAAGRTWRKPDLSGLPRKAALVVVVLGVAMAAGQFVQSGQGNRATPQADAEILSEPRDIVTLSAAAVPTPPPAPQAKAAPVAEPVALTTPEPPAPAPQAQVPPPAVAAAAPETPAAVPTCDTTLTALPAAGAMIDVVLLAPCAAETAVVVQHAGLAISARTSASGALFLTLPALDAAGRVALRLQDGTELVAEVPTDLTGIRRFAVQWQGDDRFQLHALEGDATYGAPGHVSAKTGADTGRHMTVGDASVAVPLLAEVYTFPADPAQKVRLSVEAEVTGTTCARDILGETLAAEGGQVTVTEVTLAMPGCDAVGDFLVLNNLVPETTLAAAAAD